MAQTVLPFKQEGVRKGVKTALGSNGSTANLMEEDSWVLIKKAFPGSKSHSLFVIPAEA